MPAPGTPGLLSRLTRVAPPFGKVVVGLLHFTPLPAPHRVVASVLPDGRRMVGQMDDHTQRKALFGVYEADETDALRANVRAGDCFVDVGANIGWFTTLGSQLVGPAGSVIAFEPFPTHAAILRHNAAATGLGNVTVIEAAASDQDGHITVGRQHEHDSGGVTGGPWAKHGVVEVRTTTLDASLPGDRDVAFIKIDVEGFETHVLRGGSEVLARTRAVLIELNRSALEAVGSTPEEVVGMLTAAGLTEQSLVGEPSADLTRLPEFSNMLAVRAARPRASAAAP